MAQRIRIRKKKTVFGIEQFEVRHGTKSFVCRVLASLKREGVILDYVPARRFIPCEKRKTTGFWVVKVNGARYEAKRMFFIYPERLREFQDKNPRESVIAVSLGDRESEVKKRIMRLLSLFNSIN